MSYVLITSARNEEAHIGRLIDVVVNQTLTPTRWVVVNDGSTDRTGEIVRAHLGRHVWMELVELPSHRDRSFAAKVHCFNAAYDRVKHLNYDVIGNLDADVSFDRDYLEFLIARFAEEPRLGVAGTVFIEDAYNSATDSFEGHNHVAGGCQLFRKECFADVGGYVPTKIGMDWIAVTTARMKGWKTRSFREKAFFHHRSLGTAGRGRVGASLLYGEKDYRLGWHPVYELCRVLYQLRRNPLAGFCVGLGYAGAFLKRTERPVSPELMRFHRAEQLAKIRAIARSLLMFKPVDSFQVSSQ